MSKLKQISADLHKQCREHLLPVLDEVTRCIEQPEQAEMVKQQWDSVENAKALVKDFRFRIKTQLSNDIKTACMPLVLEKWSYEDIRHFIMIHIKDATRALIITTFAPCFTDKELVGEAAFQLRLALENHVYLKPETFSDFVQTFDAEHPDAAKEIKEHHFELSW